jgi:hypothetical protein
MSEENTKGNRQRDKIPRTTQVKRLHKSASKHNTPAPLRAWAAHSGVPIAEAWLKAK